MKKRPVTTLFMLSSVDGKISTGNSDLLDVDSDYPAMDGVKEGLHQYYEIEQTTDLWSLNSGLVQAKLGVNQKEYPDKTPVSFVVIDNKNLTDHGVSYFCRRAKTFVLVTTNTQHPAFSVQEDNLHIICQKELDLRAVLEELFLQEKLFDCIDIVVAPVLIGGKDTATLIDGASITKREELGLLGVLKLVGCEVLEDSYLRLRYEVAGKIF